ncbi:MAG: hypothetical protein GTO45_14310 [Candidatus Aminicenantes bacterium]|nr:hypothetical protein [Candidatus Aminicenantes bacterium]NIM79939.1 hypothetical protein [Candidatus Aminicenantes bacterium]NIN19278.1 hypothetical protein [Candidatus Aminicenantes bacterium]NIN43181.1 hypothetical protein [Candidatus Aminicenantes bacterium]NIN85920.1 hypothetical protein [Candidatus Aminicenantes bacterium]
MSSARYISSIAVDPEGNVLTTGYTSGPVFPLKNPIFKTFSGGLDAFAAKINPDESTLEFSTYLGGRGDESGSKIYADARAIYLTGSTTSGDFPVKNAFDATHNGDRDCFVLKIDQENYNLVYSTFLGGSGEDRSSDMCIDPEGDVFITGFTTSSDFPLRGAIGKSLGGDVDAFIVGLDSTGKQPKLSTYFGGSQSIWTHMRAEDWGQGMAVIGNNIYLTGKTLSDDFPLKNELIDYHDWGGRAFISRFLYKK